MAVARMSEAVFENFIQPYSLQQKQQQAAFVLGNPPHLSTRHASHALAVIGWRSADGAWLVQNSMGPNWQNNGVGWVLGPLEAEWYGFQLDVGAPSPPVQQPEKEEDARRPPPPLETDLPFYYRKTREARRPTAEMGANMDLMIFLLTCLSIGVLAWSLCFCLR
jgi:hypothetical protein